MRVILAIIILSVVGESAFAEESQRQYSVSGNYLSGRFAANTGKYSDAAKYFEKALESRPSEEELLTEALANLTRAGDITHAVKVAEKLYSQQIRSPSVSFLLIAKEVNSGNFSKALSYAEEIPNYGFNSILMPIVKAWLLLGSGDAEEALDISKQAAESDNFSPLVSYHMALMYEITGDFKKAESSYVEALSQSEIKAQRIIEIMGSFYERRGQIEKAKALYEALTEDNADNWFSREALITLGNLESKMPVLSAREGIAEVFYNVASLIYSEENSADAYSFLNMAIYLRPDFSGAKLMLGAFLEAESKYEDAIKVYSKIDAKSVYGWRARLQIAQCLERIKGQSDAITYLRSMAAERPNSYDPYVHAGDIYRANSKFPEAIESYEAAFARIPTPQKWHWPIFYAKGIAHERIKQWDKAEEAFNKALSLAPNQPDVINYLAYSWLEMNINLKQASKMLKDAVKERPNDPAIIDSYGWSLYKLGDFDEAIKYLERAMELSPSDPHINDHLGDAYFQIGRKNEAVFQWERALKLSTDPDHQYKLQEKIRTRKISSFNYVEQQLESASNSE